MKNRLMEMRENADDLVFQIKMLAGSGDLDQATTHLINIKYVLDEAIKLHGDTCSSDTAFNLSYLMSCMDMAIHNIAGIDVNNRSRTAREAKEYRKAREEMENL